MRKSAAIIAIASSVLSIVAGIIAAVLIGYSGYVIYDSYYTQQAAFSSWDLSKYRPVLEEGGDLNFEQLQEINPDTVGWLTIRGTNIDYPVVQGKDDLEYASKDVFGNASLSGSIYLTAINTRDFTNSFNLIYGHHMANGAMFGDIEKYEDEEYFHSHQDGILITTRGVYDLKVFARIGADAYDSRLYSAGDRKSSDFPDFLEYVQSLAIQWQEGTDIYDITARIQTYLTAREANLAEYGEFNFNAMPINAIENGMQLLALSTCSDATTNGRQLLFATMKMRTEPLPEEVLGDNSVPLTPPGVRGHGQADYWSLANLGCLLLCAWMVLPVGSLRSKYGRPLLMKRYGESGEHTVRIKTLVGLGVQAAVLITAAVVFFQTQSFHNPMTVVDENTPWMLGLAALSIVADFLLFRPNKTAARPAA